MKDAELTRIARRKRKDQDKRRLKIQKILETGLQILHGWNVGGRMTETDKDEITLEGVVHLELLCTSDAESYRYVMMDIPYSHSVSVNGVIPENPCSGKLSIEQISAVIQGDRIEVRVVLSYQLLVNEKMKECLLTEMRKTEISDEDKAFPVMSVYFAKDKENIWEVGKKYQVSLDSIRKINELPSDELQDGQKLLIVKEMA